jgi:hypothetical protein
MKRAILAAFLVVLAVLARPQEAKAQCQTCDRWAGAPVCYDFRFGAHVCWTEYNPYAQPPWQCYLFGPCNL